MSGESSVVPPPPPGFVVQRSQDQIDREAREIGGPTLFANRFLVQTYPDGSLRVVFAEAFTASHDQPASFRGAFFLERGSATHLLEQMNLALGMKSVPSEPEK